MADIRNGMWFYGSSDLDEKVDGYLVMLWIEHPGYYVVHYNNRPGYDVFYAQPTIRELDLMIEFGAKYNLAVLVVGGPLAIVSNEEVCYND